MSKGFEITTSRPALLKMLTAASRVCKAKPIPVLGSVYIETAGDQLAWWATDGEFWRGGKIDATSDGKGSALIPAEQAMGIVKNLADGEVTLRLNGDVKIQSGGYRGSIPSLSTEDFPARRAGAPGPVTLGAATLGRLIAQVLPALDSSASIQGADYFLHGALLQLGPESITCVGTDRYQIAVSRAPIAEDKSREVVGEVVSRKALFEILSMVAPGEGDVAYGCDDHTNVFVAGDDVAITRSVEAKYPGWQRLIPNEWATRCVVSRADLLAALKRVELSARDEDGANGIVFTLGDGAIKVSAKSAERGDGEDSVQAAVEGPAGSFTSKAEYVRHFLSAAESEQVACEVKAGTSRVVFKEVETTGTDWTYVIATMA